MGSKAGWETVRHASEMLTSFGVPHECRVLSAHRTPEQTIQYAGAAQDRGIEVIIAGAGGAAHLPGVIAAHTLIPVLGVPIESPASARRARSTPRCWRWPSSPRSGPNCVRSCANSARNRRPRSSNNPSPDGAQARQWRMTLPDCPERIISKASRYSV